MDVPQVTLWFDESLRFFTRQAVCRLPLREKTAIKHLIESVGVPHVEVGEIRVDDQPAHLMQPAQAGQIIRVHAAAAACPLPDPRFLLDMHLGKLASYLRLLGLDTCYRNPAEDDWLAEKSAAEQRILLSRDQRLLMRKKVLYGYCPRSLDPLAQLDEVIRRFALRPFLRPLTRCLHCNTPLVSVEKAAIENQLQPLTKKYYQRFKQCPRCGQIYWHGSHVAHMRVLFEKVGLTVF